MTDSATFTTPEAGDDDLGDLLLEVLPGDGSTIGNLSAREALGRAAERQIKRSILDHSFGTKELIAEVTDRFMDLAKVRFQ
ncbi:MAG: hypothetical protein ACON4T_02745 [Synechococcus sp.]